MKLFKLLRRYLPALAALVVIGGASVARADVVDPTSAGTAVVTTVMGYITAAAVTVIGLALTAVAAWKGGKAVIRFFSGAPIK